MSDTEMAENHGDQSASGNGTPAPTPKPTPKGKGRGRGRGRKAAAAGAGKKNTANAAAATNEAPKKTIGGRRGRIKAFDDDRIQANYERQRELKGYFNQLKQMMKPALVDLANRETEDLKSDPDYYKQNPAYHKVVKQLKDRFDLRMQHITNKHDYTVEVENTMNEHKNGAMKDSYQNQVEDLEERFLDGQIRKLEVLEQLYDLGRPVDTPDDSYNYQPISNEAADEFGIFDEYLDGRLIPYPALVEGTQGHAVRMAYLNRDPLPDPDRAPAPPRAQPKRKAKDQPDGQPASKRGNAAEAVAESSQTSNAAVAPAKHTQGLLSAQVTNTASEEQSAETTPVPEGPLRPREREPALPLWAGEPDEYGCRQVNRPQPKNADPIINNRIIVPISYELDPIEIGYRDSTNDPSRKATVAKRGKYYGENGTGTWHYDPMLARHDARDVRDEDMDQDVVQRHGVHPRYGYFLPGSKNDAEDPKPFQSGQNPTVYLTPDGRTLHASRYIPQSRSERENELSERRKAMAAALAAFCKADRIDLEDIEPPEIREAREIRAVVAEQRRSAPSPEPPSESSTVESPSSVEFQPSNDSAINSQGLLELLDASLEVDSKASVPTPVSTTPVRTVTRSYDAIRDMVVERTPAPAPPVQAPDTQALSILADLCDQSPKKPTTYNNRRQEDDVSATEALSKKRPSLVNIMEEPIPGATRHESPAPLLPPVDEASQVKKEAFQDAQVPSRSALEEPYRLNHYNQGNRAPSRPSHNMPREPLAPYRFPTEEPLPALNGSQDIPIDPLLNAGPGGSHTSGGGYIEHHPPMPAIHHDLARARPVEAVHDQPKGHYPDSYSGGYHHHHPSYPSQPRHVAAPSRMPFSNPRQGQESPSLPPLRPQQAQSSFYDPPGGYYSHGPSRAAQEPSYMHTQNSQAHHESGIAPYHGSSYSQSPASYGPPAPPYAPIAPTPSHAQPAQSPPSISFNHYQPLIQSPDQHTPARPKTGSASSTPANGKYRELAPAPIPPHRQGMPQGPELRTVQYVPTENIKDYTPTEQLPARGPQVVRSWNQYSHKSNKSQGGYDRRGSS